MGNNKNKSVMKRIYTLLFAAAVVLSMTACSEKETNDPEEGGSNNGNNGTPASTIKSGKIGHGTITIAGYTEETYGVDFNNDGTLEFKLGVGGNGYVAYNWTEGGNNIVNKADQWDYIEPLAANVTVGASSRFEGQGDAMFEDMNALPATFYIGCRFKLDDGVHYGWVKASRQDGREVSVQWDKCAYNSKPGEAIPTGKE